MRQFTVGRFKTVGGFDAHVLKLSQVGVDWVLKGAVNCAQSGVSVLTYWTLSGVSLGIKHPDYNLEVAA